MSDPGPVNPSSSVNNQPPSSDPPVVIEQSPRPNPIVGPNAMWWACRLGLLGGALLAATLVFSGYEIASQISGDRCSAVLPNAAKATTTDKDNAGQIRIVDAGPEKVQLGSRLCVAVAGVATKPAANQPSTVDVTLFLNDQRSPLTVKAPAVPDIQFLSYDLAQPTDANTDPAKFWRAIVAGKTRDGTVPLAVGLSRTNSTAPEVTADKPVVRLVVYRWLIVILGASSLVVLILAFIIYAANTTILRDNNNKDGGVPSGTFSLGKTQMALWLVLATAGFIFLWLTLGLYLHVITAGILVLLGINGATGLAAVAIDNTSTGKTQGFFNDIMSDGAGPQLHRIQVVAWTLILGVIFLWNVVWNFMFVDFDTNLLLLMGIANAMYLGFKPKEK